MSHLFSVWLGDSVVVAVDGLDGLSSVLGRRGVETDDMCLQQRHE
jgi:hypothetical protein